MAHATTTDSPTKTCANCGSTFTRRKYESKRDYGRRITCNPQCSRQNRRKRAIERAQHAHKTCEHCKRPIPIGRLTYNEYASRKYCDATCRKQAEQKRQAKDAEAVLNILAAYGGLPLHTRDFEDELDLSNDRVRSAIRMLKKHQQIATKPNPDFAPGEPHTLYFVPDADGRPTR